MDPFTTVTTVITLATAIKDVIQLAIAFKNSLDTVPYNIRSLKDDVKHVIKLLDLLKLHASLSGDTSDMGLDTADQIMELRSGFIDLHKQHLQLLQDLLDPQFRSWSWVPLSLDYARKRLLTWYKRDETSGEISRLRKLVEQMQVRFFMTDAIQARKHRKMDDKVTSLLLLDTAAGKEAFSRRKFVRYISDQASNLSELLRYHLIDCR